MGSTTVASLITALQIVRTGTEIANLLAQGEITEEEAQVRLEQVGRIVSQARARWKAADQAARTP